MKKRISVAVDEELDIQLSNKVKEIGISKSAFVAFATSFFLHQLEHTENSLNKYQGVYELIKANYEDQLELNRKKHL